MGAMLSYSGDQGALTASSTQDVGRLSDFLIFQAFLILQLSWWLGGQGILESWEHGALGTMLAMQTQGPELGCLAPPRKSSVAVYICTPSAYGEMLGV